MKKGKYLILFLVVVLALALVLTACGSEGSGTNKGGTVTPGGNVQPGSGDGDNAGDNTGDNTGNNDNTGENQGDGGNGGNQGDGGNGGSQEDIKYAAPQITAIDADNVKVLFGGEEKLYSLFATAGAKRESVDYIAEQVASVFIDAELTVQQINAIMKDLEPIVWLYEDNFVSEDDPTLEEIIRSVVDFFADFTMPTSVDGVDQELVSGLTSGAKDIAIRVLDICTKENIITVTDALSGALSRLTAKNIAYLAPADYVGQFVYFGEDGVNFTTAELAGIFADQETFAEVFDLGKTLPRAIVDKAATLDLIEDLKAGVNALLLFDAKTLANALDTVDVLVKVSDKILSAEKLDISQIVSIVGSEIGVWKAATIQSDIDDILALAGKLLKTAVEGMNKDGTLDADLTAFVNEMLVVAGSEEEVDLTGTSDIATFVGDVMSRLDSTKLIELFTSGKAVYDGMAETEGEPTEDVLLSVGKFAVNVLQFIDKNDAFRKKMGADGKVVLNNLFLSKEISDGEEGFLDCQEYLDTLFYIGSRDRRMARSIMTDQQKREGIAAEDMYKYFTDEELIAIGELMQNAFFDAVESGMELYSTVMTAVQERGSAEPPVVAPDSFIACCYGCGIVGIESDEELTEQEVLDALSMTNAAVFYVYDRDTLRVLAAFDVDRVTAVEIGAYEGDGEYVGVFVTLTDESLGSVVIPVVVGPEKAETPEE